jgi:hypothetical protein
MKDYLDQLEHLEKQAAECELIGNLSENAGKRSMFRKLAEQYRAMAEGVRQQIGAAPSEPSKPSS